MGCLSNYSCHVFSWTQVLLLAMAHKHQTAIIMLTTKWVSRFLAHTVYFILCTIFVLQRLQHFKSMDIYFCYHAHSFYSWLLRYTLCSLAGPSQPGPPGRQLGHYPSLPPGYQNTSVSHGATAPMHPAMQAAAQPYSQATQPYQQVRMKLVRCWLFALSFLMHLEVSAVRSVHIYIVSILTFHYC